MQTTIDNNQRVFQIITSTGKQVFCNLADIKKVLHNIGAVEGYYTIKHIWNNKALKCSKKLLNDMFKAANIDVNNKIFTIDIQAKEWFDKVNGNSYHAGEVTTNFGNENEQTFEFGLSYGYDSHYKQTAFELLFKNGVIPCDTVAKISDYIKHNKIEVRANIVRGCKKAELTQYDK